MRIDSIAAHLQFDVRSHHWSAVLARVKPCGDTDTVGPSPPAAACYVIYAGLCSFDLLAEVRHARHPAGKSAVSCRLTPAFRQGVGNEQASHGAGWRARRPGTRRRLVRKGGGAVRIPRFWAVADGSGTGPRGETLFRRAWGWSMSSTADALDVAHARLRSALASIRSGTRVGGYYPRVPLREPILDELIVDGEQALAVTRNRYGADILNTDRILIADVDLPDMYEPTGGGLLRRLFRRQRPQPAPRPEPPAVVKRLAKIAAWARANPGLGVIVYRTASGLRVFVTGTDEPASSDRGSQILVELDADPIYRELCRAHGTFRARLTPKPWRLPGFRAPGQQWPYPDEPRFLRWLERYEAAAQAYAVCRPLARHGPELSTLDEQILRLHDERTRAWTGLPLA